MVLIALGANEESPAGPPVATLDSALRDLGDSHLSVERVSRFYKTPCFPKGAGPDYVNAAAVFRGSDAPDAILSLLHDVEERYGRLRVQRWGSRSLDLDLIAVGDRVCPDEMTWRHWHDLPAEAQRRAAPDRLILPHPRLQDRAFVLVPLAEVAPDWVHPVTGRSVRRMRDALPAADLAAVIPL